MAEPIKNVIEPQNVDTVPSSICSTGLAPVVINGVLLWAIRHLFSNPDYIISDNAKSFIWNKDSTQSNILIEPVTSWTPANIQTLQKLPAILLKRGPWAPVKLALGDVYQGANIGIDMGRNIVDNNAIKHEVIITGSHNIFCIGRQGIESEVIAAEVFYYLLEFGQIMRQDYNLNMFNVKELGGVTKVDEAHEHWGVPITVTYAYNHGWNITPRARMFKGVSLRIDVV